MQAFMVRLLITVLVEAAKNEDIQAFVADQIGRLAKTLKDDLLPDIVGTFPALGAALLKTAFEKLPNVADLPEDVATLARESIEKLAAGDPDIPGLSDIFDVSEWLNRLGGR